MNLNKEEEVSVRIKEILMKPRNRNVPRIQEKNPEAQSWYILFISLLWLVIYDFLSLSISIAVFYNSQVQREGNMVTNSS